MLPTPYRQDPDADFGKMRHRVNARDFWWRGKQDPERARGLINAEFRKKKRMIDWGIESGDIKGARSDITKDSAQQGGPGGVGIDTDSKDAAGRAAGKGRGHGGAIAAHARAGPAALADVSAVENSSGTMDSVGSVTLFGSGDARYDARQGQGQTDPEDSPLKEMEANVAKAAKKATPTKTTKPAARRT